MPESSTGAMEVTVAHDDGTRSPDAHVAWGTEVVTSSRSSDIPFAVSRVVTVVLET